MKLNGFKVDASTIEDGEWIDDIPGAGDLRLRVRGLSNADAIRLRSRLVAAVPRGERSNGSIDPKHADEIAVKVIVSTVLLGWENLVGDDDQPIPFTTEKATELLSDPDYAPLRDAVTWAAAMVGERQADARKVDAGN